MLLRLAAAYVAGLLAASPARGVGNAVVLLVAVAASISFRGRKPRFAHGWLPAVGLAAVLGALAARESQRRIDLELDDVRVEGWIATRPETSALGTRAWFVVERFAVDAPRPPQRHGTRVLLQARGRLPGGYGQRLRVQGQWRAGRGPRNFHAFDERGMLAAHAATAVLVARDIEPLSGVAGNRWQRDWIEPARDRLAARIAATLAAREASILTALVLGIDDDIGVDVQETWRGLGMTHVLAVSGMHVSLVVTALVACGGTPRRRRGCLVLVAGVLAYSALAGLAPSVLRAAAMASWAAVALHLGRPRGGTSALLLASATLLLGSGELRHDLGFQLSCASTLGILIWAGPLQAIGRRARAVRIWGRPAAFFVTSVGLGLAAQLATLPLAHARFGYLSLAAPLADLFLVPLANTALVLGLAGAPLALVAPELARPLWIDAGALLHLTLGLADRIMRAGDPRWFLPTTGAAIALTVLACTATLVAGWRANWRRRQALACVAVGGLAIAALAGLTLRPAAPAWRLEALDVGQGDALVLGLGRDTWLLDAGDSKPVDRGAHVILPHLRRLGVRRLRGLVLTHPHLDHCGGAASVLTAMRVDTLYVAAVSAAAAPYAALQRLGVPMRLLRAGERLSLGPGAAARVLWPPETDALASGANAQSVVLLISGPGHPHVLAMGDLEADGETRLVSTAAAQLAAVAPDFLVLKAGHHGSRTSSTPQLLDACDPEVALISVGEHNRYGHPAAATLDALAARDCTVLRTDRGGAVRLVLRGSTLWLERPAARPQALRSPTDPIDAATAGP